MEKQHLIDFADWLLDRDRLKVTTQLPPFEDSAMMVEFYLKAKMLNNECDGKSDSTIEKDLRVCNVVASASLPEGFKVYTCANCQEINVLRDNNQIRVGFCTNCEHPIWND